MAAKAIAGTIAGLGLVGAGVAGLGIAGEDNTTRDERGAVVEEGEIGAFRIRLGDCLESLIDGVFESATAVPCDQPHVFEVVGAFNAPYGPDAPFPGAEVLGGVADGCLAEFAEFVGIPYEQSEYFVTPVLPTEGSWTELDDREILCLASTADETVITGSLRGARR